MIFYRQCELRRGNAKTTSWLPEKYAEVGKPLKLKDDGIWVDGWIVESVSSLRRGEAEVHERSRDYLKQRKASDIMRGER